MVSWMVKPAANEIVETDNAMRSIDNPKPRLYVVVQLDRLGCLETKTTDEVILHELKRDLAEWLESVRGYLKGGHATFY